MLCPTSFGNETQVCTSTDKAIWYVSVKHLGIETFTATITALITAQYWIVWQSLKKNITHFCIFIKLDSKFSYLLIEFHVPLWPFLKLWVEPFLGATWNINNGNKHFWFCHLLCCMKIEKNLWNNFLPQFLIDDKITLQ